MKKNYRIIMLYILILGVLVAVVASQMGNTASSANKVEKIPTSEFVTLVDDGLVKTADYKVSNAELTGEYWKTEKDKKAKKDPSKYESTYIGADALAELMAKNPEVTYNVDASEPSALWSIIGTLLPILLIGGIMIYFLNQTQAGNNKAMQFGRSSAKLNSGDKSKVTFKDVAGADEAIEELDEIREFLSNPEKFQKMGAKIPRGVLLVGPPGTGKTLLARAVAGEASVPFYSISGSDFVEMFVGVGASRVRDLFKQAKETAPSIIFIDEIDAVGRQRGAGMGGGHDEREQTLNQLLVEMDGFDVNDSVILIAATNRPDVLDPALLRPGRFDRQIVVDRPDMKGRLEILQVHAKGKPIAKEVDLEILAKRTPGFTGADLANLLNEAALLAARFNKKEIGMDELGEAIDRVMSGPERKSRIISDKEKKVIAYHEAGHALVGHVLEHADQIHKISIIARGQALGYTLSLPTEDRFLTSRQEMLDDLVMFLGGRVAEEVACGDVTTGASNDLERATKIARQMVTRFGMTQALGTQVYGDPEHNPFLGRDYSTTPEYSPETAARIDAEVSRLMTEAHQRAEEILVNRREQLDLIVDVLIERETIDIEAVTALLDNKWDEYLVEEKKRNKEQAERVEEIKDRTSADAPTPSEAEGSAAPATKPAPAQASAPDAPAPEAPGSEGN